MSLSKLLLKHDLINMTILEEVIADVLPEELDKYYSNFEIVNLLDNKLKIRIGDNWLIEEPDYEVEFEITKDGNLKYIKYEKC